MRVLFLTTGAFPSGGASGRCVHMISQGLVELGHLCTVLASRRSEPGSPTAIIDGIDVRWAQQAMRSTSAFGWRRAFAVALMRASFARALRSLTHEKPFDWAIFPAPSLDALLALWSVSQQHGIKLAPYFTDIVHPDVNLHMVPRLSARAAEFIGAKIADAVLTVPNELLESKFRRLAPGKPVIPLMPPTNVGLFSSAEGGAFCRRHRLSGLTLLGYAGGFKPHEGLEELLETLSPLLVQHEGTRLVIAGGGITADFERIKKKAQALPCHHQVVFPGQLGLGEVAAMLKACSVLILPKTDHPINHFATPIKLGEYLASGRPVVSAAIGGIPKYVVNGRDACLYKPGDWQSLHAAVATILRDTQRASDLGREALKTARRSFETHVVCEQLARDLQAANHF